MSALRKVFFEGECTFSSVYSSDEVTNSMASVEGLTESRKLRSEISHADVLPEDFYRWSQRILYTDTPAVLIMDQRRKLIFANSEGYRLLEQGQMIAVDKDGCLYCQDLVAQEFLVSMLTGGNMAFSNDQGSCLIPKADGWPLISIAGQDQLGSPDFKRLGFETDSHMTLMLRDIGGSNNFQSTCLSGFFDKDLFGLTDGSEGIAGEADFSLARDRAQEAIRTAIEMKYVKNKMEAERLSEFISLYLKHIS
jgi:hypothetical protein